MNLHKYIPGFRSDNPRKQIIAFLYYFIPIIYLTRVEMFTDIFIGLSILSVPFVLFGIIDLFKGKFADNPKKEFIICLLPILLLAICYGIGSSGFNEKTYYGYVNEKKYDIRYYESRNKELKESIDYMESDEYINEVTKDEELISLQKENKEIALVVDEYKEEIKEIEEEIEKEKKIEMEKESYLADSSNNSYGDGYSNSYSNSNGSYSGGSRYNNYNSSNNSSSNKHIGKGVFIAAGNRYYHAISNCKYLEGASTSYVTLTYNMNKFECNCWTNPVVYKPSSSSSSSGSNGSSSSGGRTVYIAPGNSYYHASSSCKFLRGASTQAVGINNVGGKHPCNCIKY